MVKELLRKWKSLLRKKRGENRFKPTLSKTQKQKGVWNVFTHIFNSTNTDNIKSCSNQWGNDKFLFPACSMLFSFSSLFFVLFYIRLKRAQKGLLINRIILHWSILYLLIVGIIYQTNKNNIKQEKKKGSLADLPNFLLSP